MKKLLIALISSLLVLTACGDYGGRSFVYPTPLPVVLSGTPIAVLVPTPAPTATPQPTATPAPTATPMLNPLHKALVLTTDFAVTGRYTSATTGTGAVSITTSGIQLTTGATATSSVISQWSPIIGNGDTVLTGSPTFSVHINPSPVGSDLDLFVGFGQFTDPAGAAITFTQRHIGFKITRRSSGTTSLYATQANGTTETTSLLTSSVLGNDEYDLIFHVNGTSSVDYYFRRNNGGLSSATNLTATFPLSVNNMVQMIITNVGVADTSTVVLSGASYIR